MRPLEPMRVDAGVYGGLLAEQLRLAGMREDRVRVVVHDVLSHVRATGEDPVEAFGQPADYAAQWVRPLSAASVTLRMLATAVAFVAAWALVRAVLVGGPWSGVTDVYWSDVTIATTMAVMGSVVPWTVGRALNRRAARRLGSTLRPGDTTVRVTAVLVVLAVLVVAGQLLVPGYDGGTVLFALPRWVLLAAGVAGVVLLFAVRGPDGRSLPRSPTDHRSPLTRVRGLLWHPGRRP